MKTCNRVKKIDANLIPQPSQAVSDYRLNGGTITDPNLDIEDPLFNNPTKINLRFQSFVKRFPSFDVIFYCIINENTSNFC